MLILSVIRGLGKAHNDMHAVAWNYFGYSILFNIMADKMLLLFPSFQ